VLFGASEGLANTDWTPTPDDSLLFDARLGDYRLGDGIRGYQKPDAICVDFGDTIAALDLPITIDQAGQTARGWAFSEDNRIIIDREAQQVTTGDTRRRMGADDIATTPEGWCVSADTLGQWLGIQFSTDLRNAVIEISSDQPLPVERALARRNRASGIRPRLGYDLNDLPHTDVPYRLWRTPSVDVVVAVGGLQDRALNRERVTRRYELFAAGELLTASVDARLASDDRGVPNSLRMRAFRSSPDGNLLGPLGATHFAIGDVSSQSSPIAVQPMSGRGAIITNRPLDRPENFDRRTFRGDLPAGWDAELYRNGQLLAFSVDRGDGRYEFVDIELRYGINRFEVVLYGPQGQIRRETELINVGATSIPPRKTWYWAGISQDNRDLVTLDRQDFSRRANWRAGFGIERGLNARTSLAFQLNNLVIGDQRVTILEGSVRRSIGPALVEVTGAWSDNGGYAARAQVLGRFGRTYVSAETILADDFSTERYGTELTGRHSLAVDHSLRLGRTVMPLRLQASYETHNNGREEIDVSARVSANLRRFSLTGELGFRRINFDLGAAGVTETTAAFLANGRIGSVRVRGEARWRLSPDNRFESATVTAEWRSGDNNSWRAQLGYDTALDRARVNLGYVRRFNRLAVTASAEAASDGSLAAGLNIAFSIGPNPGGGIQMTADKLASNGQTLARVFRDLNNDGIRQPGEPLEAGVEVTSGNVAAARPTNADGETMVNMMTPYRAVLVGIDTSSLTDPFVQPRGPGMVVTPRPGVAPARSTGCWCGAVAGRLRASISSWSTSPAAL
jgi:hypothetical protein